MCPPSAVVLRRVTRLAAEPPVRMFAIANSRFTKKRDPNGIILSFGKALQFVRLRQRFYSAHALGSRTSGSNVRYRELAFHKKTRP